MAPTAQTRSLFFMVYLKEVNFMLKEKEFKELVRDCFDEQFLFLKQNKPFSKSFYTK